MDIIRQISILLWILGGVIITPPVLRHFNVDVKTVYRKVLMADSPDPDPDQQASSKNSHFIDLSVFDELFTASSEAAEQATSPAASAVKQPAQPEAPSAQQVKQAMEELETAAKQAAENVHEVPAPFYVPENAYKKLHWIAPPPGFLTAETFNYLIYREKVAVGEKLKTVLDTIHGNLMLDLTPFTLISKPNKILVILFGDKSNYIQFTKRPSWSGAASDLRTDTMYVLEGPNFYPMSVHELTHLYFDGYFLPSLSPLWLSEGMAVYVQIFSTKKKPSWLDKNLEKILDGRYIPLEDMMKMEDLSALSTAQAELWYTQAYSVVNYLITQRSRDEFYRFCNELKNGAPVYQALYRAYGRPFTKISILQNVWLLDLAKRMQKPASASDRAPLPARVLSSTQTVSVPPAPVKPRTAAAVQPKQVPPQRTKIPVLKKVDPHAYWGGNR